MWDGVGIGVCATEIVIVLNIIDGRGKDSIKWVLSMLVYILSLVLKAILSEIIYLVEFMEGSIIQQESEREKGIKMLQELPLQ